ncbi:MAG: DsbE family thiol:disulfide interchange protein [Gammaproteobacteria bacterium]|uniref:DsbE family thiol:disulfide interchange protein n=1 Tax=Rhodoferax sp. TaxID=50421 RepID=UPI00184D2BA6|nr:DsbE family thiol:disulfide interchange protein [Rhodoferax sp.]MBU3900825.1 DsbE family thiol:disulfide interchange protein [Gammaproteobacteria bacterium]MBA3060022.1 DsbE family thiol:disulfide interchange protein [Rhodoferax sp.]MBU3996587.1 DsbE family thiol:disulfide interchange protein [Gammaproteobacteria bacterium]MBU4079576.1 DsbE family thiol:disulfide interchange protein [Gammaproteobacteria bacterium]MBU4112246.1 DsbE family thiol:disulfide interchange protein [Gammaproteobacte
MKKTLIPLGLFIVLVVFLAIGLTRDPSQVPSPLIGKAAPIFTAPRLHDASQQFSSKDMLGKVWLLNVWASWCVACRQEHPILMEFAKTKTVPLIGLDYKDQMADGLKWLARFGDPYDLSVTDRDGRIGIDFGVYGVPETFVIDKAGMIRHKQIGPVTEEALRDTILPLIQELQK